MPETGLIIWRFAGYVCKPSQAELNPFEKPGLIPLYCFLHLNTLIKHTYLCLLGKLAISLFLFCLAICTHVHVGWSDTALLMFLQWLNRLLKSPTEVIIYIFLCCKDNLNIMEGVPPPQGLSRWKHWSDWVLDGAFLLFCQEEIKLEKHELSHSISLGTDSEA